MRRLMTTTALAVAIAMPAFAQEAESDQSMYMTEMGPQDLFGSEIIGKQAYVRDEEVAPAEIDPVPGAVPGYWDNVGAIDDLIIGTDGTVKAAIIDFGGFLGIGAKPVAIPMSEVTFVPDSVTPGFVYAVLSLDRADLEAAPEFTGPDMAVRYTGAPMTQEQIRARQQATGAYGAWPPAPQVQREGYMMVEADDFTTDDLIGAGVYDANDNYVGDIGQMVVEADGTVSEAVVDVGGFLGIGEKSVALPFDRLSVQRSLDGQIYRVYVDVTEQRLEDMPEFTG